MILYKQNPADQRRIAEEEKAAAEQRRIAEEEKAAAEQRRIAEEEKAAAEQRRIAEEENLKKGELYKWLRSHLTGIF